MSKLQKIGLGSGCHWCTESTFHSLIDENKVDQGWISSIFLYESLSEAVMVYFDSSIHKMRYKYQSAVYFSNEIQQANINKSINSLNPAFLKPIITLVLPFVAFKLNKAEQLNHFLSHPNNPFCKKYIHPKLTLIKNEFNVYVNHQHLKYLNV